MTTTGSNPSSILPYFSQVYKKWWYILLCTAIVVAPVYYYNRTATPYYRATATVLCEDLQQLSSQTALNPDSRKSYLRNKIELIKSRSMAEMIANLLPHSVANQFVDIPNFNPQDIQHMSRVVAAIRNSMSAEHVKDSDILRINADTRQQELCIVLVNTILDLLKRQGTNGIQMGGSNIRSYFSRQYDYFNKQWNDARAHLDELRKDELAAFDPDTLAFMDEIVTVDVVQQMAILDGALHSRYVEYLFTAFLSLEMDTVLTYDLITQQVNNHDLSQLRGLHRNLLPLLIKYSSDPDQIKTLQNEIAKEKEALVRTISESMLAIEPALSTSSVLPKIIELVIEMDILAVTGEEMKTFVANSEIVLESMQQPYLEITRLNRKMRVSREILQYVDEKMEQTAILKFGAVSIIDRAELMAAPVRPRKTANLIAGAIIGIICGFLFSALLAALDTNLRFPQHIQQRTGLPVIGIIPMGDKPPTAAIPQKKAEDKTQNHTTTDAYYALRENIFTLHNKKSFSTFLLSNPSYREGKSIVAFNTACALAERGRPTLLIDANLRFPMLHTFFAVDRSPGLTDLVQACILPPINGGTQKSVGAMQIRAEKESAGHNNGWPNLNISFMEMLHRSRTHPALSILPAGSAIDKPLALLSKDVLSPLLSLASEMFDFVIVDAPSVRSAPEVTSISPLIDGVLFVLGFGRYRAREVLDCKSYITHAGGNVIGVVLKDMPKKYV